MSKGDRPAAPLKMGEPERILRACLTARERVLVVLLWRAGLRVSEACGLVGSDVELDEEDGSAMLRIRHGKGNRQRFVALDPLSAAVVKPLVNGGPVLVTTTGTPLDPIQARRIVRRAAKTAKVPGRVHPHAFRHTCARNLHDEGFSAREIQVVLGHGSLATTQKYLTSIGCDEVAAKTKRREWQAPPDPL